MKPATATQRGCLSLAHLVGTVRRGSECGGISGTAYPTRVVERYSSEVPFSTLSRSILGARLRCLPTACSVAPMSGVAQGSPRVAATDWRGRISKGERLVGFVLGGLLVAGCMSAPAASRQSSGASPSASGAAATPPSPSTASAPRTGAPTAPSEPASQPPLAQVTDGRSAVTFICKLPVAVPGGWDAADQPRPSFGAFIDFPTGRMAAAASGGFTWSGPGRRELLTTQKPVLQGSGPGISYSKAVDRWLPVDRNLVAADGLSYVTPRPLDETVGTNPRFALIRVDARTGEESTLLADSRLYPDEYNGTVVYLRPALYEGVPSGLWALDVPSGGMRQVRTDGAWWAISGTWAWGVQFASADSRFGYLGSTTDHIDRLDLGSGAVSTWYRRPGTAVWFDGLSGTGTPVVHVIEGEIGHYYAVPAAGVLAPMFDQPNSGIQIFLADRHGIWFGKPRSPVVLGLYNDSTGVVDAWTAARTMVGFPLVAGACT